MVDLPLLLTWTSVDDKKPQFSLFGAAEKPQIGAKAFGGFSKSSSLVIV